MQRWIKYFLLVLLVIILIQYFYSGTIDPKYSKGIKFEIIAHRGVSQTFHKKNINNQTCTAVRIFKPRHQYMENTIESIQAAFDFGATIVEIDIRPTKDKQLVVFHDNRLECRTNGHGEVKDYTVAQLKKLDVGYGYTHDGGKSYPFRGKGIGKIHTLDEILRLFPNRKFLIDNKNGASTKVAQLIVNSLSRLPEKQQNNIYLWTYDSVFEYIRRSLPNTRRLLLPRKRVKKFFLKYELSLGLASVGDEYRGQGLGLPVEYTKYIWAWPNRFLNKVYSGGARFYLLINKRSDLKAVAGIPLNGIITDNIDLLGEDLKSRENQPYSSVAD